MDVTNRNAVSTGLQRIYPAWGRIAFVSMQCGALLWMGGITVAEQPKVNGRQPQAPMIEVVPQQELSGDRLAPTPSGADLPAVKPLRDISYNIRVSGEAPADVSAPSSGPEQTVGGREIQRGFANSMFFWQASNMVHRPLYFEQRYVERYGANFGVMQPIASGVQFAADTALLPAKMLVHPPRECVYTLGYGRPGSSGTRCPRY